MTVIPTKNRMKMTACAVFVGMCFLLLPISASAVIPQDGPSSGDARDAVWQEVLSYRFTNRPSVPSETYAVFFNFLYTNDFTQQELNNMSHFASTVFEVWNGYKTGSLEGMSNSEFIWLLAQAAAAAKSVNASLTYSGDAFGGMLTITKDVGTGVRTYVFWAKYNSVHEPDCVHNFAWDSWYTSSSTPPTSAVTPGPVETLPPETVPPLDPGGDGPDPPGVEEPGGGGGGGGGGKPPLIGPGVGDGGKVIKATGLSMDFSGLSLMLGMIVALFVSLGVYVGTTSGRKKNRVRLCP